MSRDSPVDFEGRVKVSGEVDKVQEFCTGARGSPGAVVGVAEKELGDTANVCLE